MLSVSPRQTPCSTRGLALATGVAWCVTSFDRVRGDPRGHALLPDRLQAVVEGKTESGAGVELASQWTKLRNGCFNGLRVVRV